MRSFLGAHERMGDTYGYLWIFMDIYGYLIWIFIWIFMDIYGYLIWIFDMDIYGYLWIFMDIYGYLWIFDMDIYMDIYGYLWIFDIHAHFTNIRDQCIQKCGGSKAAASQHLIPFPLGQLQAAVGRGSARCHSARPLQRCWAAATSPRPSDERRHPSPPRACPARTLQVGKPGIPQKKS